jgi:hypothetical protein
MFSERVSSAGLSPDSSTERILDKAIVMTPKNAATMNNICMQFSFSELIQYPRIPDQKGA